jgi:hypothetical protein
MTSASRVGLALLKTIFWIYVCAAWASVAVLASFAAGLALPADSWAAKMAITPLAFIVGAVFCDADTVYASGYSEAAFETVRPGMTTTEVEKRLGPPLGVSKNRDGGESWFYSRHGARSDDFENRVVLFGPNRLVEDTHACCYGD